MGFIPTYGIGVEILWVTSEPVLCVCVCFVFKQCILQSPFLCLLAGSKELQSRTIDGRAWVPESLHGEKLPSSLTVYSCTGAFCE